MIQGILSSINKQVTCFNGQKNLSQRQGGTPGSGLREGGQMQQQQQNNSMVMKGMGGSINNSHLAVPLNMFNNMMQSMPDNAFLKEQYGQQSKGGQMRNNQPPTRSSAPSLPGQNNSHQQHYDQNQSQVYGRGNEGYQEQQYQEEEVKNSGRPNMQQTISDQSFSQGIHSSNTFATNDNFKVVLRVRPPLPKEQDPFVPFRSIVHVSQENKSVSIMDYMGAEVNEAERQRDIADNPHLCVWQHFTFDYVYDLNSTQHFVYDNTARPAVLSVLEGYNATILAYGQTGAGKTHTMEGFKYSGCDPQRGIVPRSMEEVFKYIENCSNSKSTFMVRASYLQIYNEVISDLLKAERTSLHIREDKKKGVFVEGLSEWAVRSPNEIYSLMQKGAMSRATASNKINDVSSRSHAVFIIIVEQMTLIEENGFVYSDDCKQIKVGKLNLVDLAGSERVSITGATGKRLEESKKINQSLSFLGKVIAALTDAKSRTHIPYRDSKLTRLLEDSLGGNCKTTMMAMISPSPKFFPESVIEFLTFQLSTLKFATRAKKIKNNPKINEDVDQRALLRKYEVELRNLKSQLENKSKTVIDKERFLQMENERKRAEEDRNAAITALETRSREFLMEKEEKKRLEEKIKSMNSQMLVGGQKIEETPQFRVALEEKQKQIRREYEVKLMELEKERSLIEEDKSQVDRYKQLLVKQRDIMIALTARLNERDETIIQLQEELDAYDRIHRETECTIDSCRRRIEQLEQFIDQNNLPVPDYEDEDYQNVEQIRTEKMYCDYNGEKKFQPHELTIQMAQREEGNGSFVPPLQLLSAEEKVNELISIIQKQNCQLEKAKEDIDRVTDPEQRAGIMQDRINEYIEKEVHQRMGNDGKNQNMHALKQQLHEEQERNKSLLSIVQDSDRGDMGNTQERAKVSHFLANDLMSMLNQVSIELKEQNDNYRFHHMIQNVRDIQKNIAEFHYHLNNQEEQSTSILNGQQMASSQRSSIQRQSSENRPPTHQPVPASLHSSFAEGSPRNSNSGSVPFGGNNQNLKPQQKLNGNPFAKPFKEGTPRHSSQNSITSLTSNQQTNSRPKQNGLPPVVNNGGQQQNYYEEKPGSGTVTPKGEESIKGGNSQQSSGFRLGGGGTYERKLPPNVEEMISQRRQELARQLHQA